MCPLFQGVRACAQEGPVLFVRCELAIYRREIAFKRGEHIAEQGGGDGGDSSHTSCACRLALPAAVQCASHRLAASQSAIVCQSVVRSPASLVSGHAVRLQRPTCIFHVVASAATPQLRGCARPLASPHAHRLIRTSTGWHACPSAPGSLHLTTHCLLFHTCTHTHTHMHTSVQAGRATPAVACSAAMWMEGPSAAHILLPAPGTLASSAPSLPASLAHTYTHTNLDGGNAPAVTCSAVMDGGIQRCPPSTITNGSMRHVRRVSPSHSEYRRHLHRAIERGGRCGFVCKCARACAYL